MQFIATYPAPDIDFRTNPFQLVGDMRILSSPYDCIVGVHCPTKMEGSLVRKYPSTQEVVIFLHTIATSFVF